MIGYICKYAPAEIIEAFGEETFLIEPHASSFPKADCLMHSNMCSYIKGVLEDFENAQDAAGSPDGGTGKADKGAGCGCRSCTGCDALLSAYSPEYMKACDGMVFTTCCDSSRRLFDTLKRKHPEKFFFCLDLPRKINPFSAKLYERQIEELITAYGKFSGKTFSKERFLDICARKSEISLKTSAGRTSYNASGSRLRVALCGARCSSDVKLLIEKLGADIILDMTCSSMPRAFSLSAEDAVSDYSRCLLGQIPCMRMAPDDEREQLIGQYEKDLDGIIYHTIKFCDIYPYEYTSLHSAGAHLPILSMETDATDGCGGQILTRLEAFLEELGAAKESTVDMTSSNDKMAASKDTASPKAISKGGRIYVCGIDSGSTSTNAVIMDGERNIIARCVLRTGAKSEKSARQIFEEILAQAGLKRDDISLIVSTGYGRVSIPFADKNVTEISCHARGAHFVNPKVRTILDIGGQDSKAIRTDENGNVKDFAMNDKCAAGTGRFLEMMARTLEIDISELGPLSLKYKENIEISSMCSVFAESEVISLIAQNKDTADIARGIHMAIGKKAFSLMNRVGLEGAYMMTGGVAKNPGVVNVMEGLLRSPLYIYEQPEIVGAIGAALCGLEDPDLKA